MSTNGRNLSKTRRPRPVEKVIGGATRAGRDVWRVTSHGKVSTITTSVVSARAMDEAMKIYGRALRRLADK